MTTDNDLVIRDLRVAPIAAPEREILNGHRPDGQPRRGSRDHGSERLGQDHPGLRPDGSPGLYVTGGSVTWQGRDVLKLSPDKRSRLGMFLAFQYPTAIPGLSVASFIRSALNAKIQGIDKDPNIDPTDMVKGGGLNMGQFRG